MFFVLFFPRFLGGNDSQFDDKKGCLKQPKLLGWFGWLMTHWNWLVQLLATSSANISNIDFYRKKRTLEMRYWDVLGSKKSPCCFPILGRDEIHIRNPGIKGGIWSLSPKKGSFDPGTDTCLPRTGSQWLIRFHKKIHAHGPLRGSQRFWGRRNIYILWLGGLPMDAAMGYEIIPLRLVWGMKDLMLQGYGIYGHVEPFALKQRPHFQPHALKCGECN